MIVFQIFGFKYGKERYEAVVCMLLAAIISFVLALNCYYGIGFDSGTWTNGSIAILFTVNGIISILFFAGYTFNVLAGSVLDADTFDQKIDELRNR
ncbi:hypothetical protein [Methanolapillus africanus]